VADFIPYKDHNGWSGKGGGARDGRRQSHAGIAQAALGAVFLGEGRRRRSADCGIRRRRSQTWTAVPDNGAQDMLAQRVLDLKRIENGVNLVEFTNAQAAMLTSADVEKRSQALTYASTLLPPEQACVVINAVIIASPGHPDFVSPA
jgi:hypothetical protein